MRRASRTLQGRGESAQSQVKISCTPSSCILLGRNCLPDIVCGETCRYGVTFPIFKKVGPLGLLMVISRK